jgi:hypothetical protein
MPGSAHGWRNDHKGRHSQADESLRDGQPQQDACPDQAVLVEHRLSERGPSNATEIGTGRHILNLAPDLDYCCKLSN